MPASHRTKMLMLGCVILSPCLYVLSFFLPVREWEIFGNAELGWKAWLIGLIATVELLTGYSKNISPQFVISWLANPLYLAAAILCWKNHWQLARVLSFGAVLCALNILFDFQGWHYNGQLCGAGYLCWVASFALLAAAARSQQ